MKSYSILSVFLTCCLLCCVPDLRGQTAENLRPYEAFFREKTQAYQQWLTQSGLGRTIRVETLDVRDTALVLYLGFYSTDADTVLAQWNQLRTDFRKTNGGGALETALFNKMLYYLEIKPRQGQIRLYDNYSAATACFKYKIFFRNDSIVSADNGCKNQVRGIQVNPSDLSAANGKKLGGAEFKKRYGKTAVFQKLTPYLRSRYEKPQCESTRQPRFELYTSTDDLHFVVNDLCKEVLLDEDNPWWCKTLYGAGCNSCKNCIKRERLDIRISYEEQPAGFNLNVDVSAAYGSGWYDKPRDNGYHDLELDYPQYLSRYADKLAGEIRQFLLQKLP